jgi:hypothetical protein
MKHTKTQIQHFYASQFNFAAQMHERMAQMQKDAGLFSLAKDSQKTAMARRISASNADMGTPKEALDYGEWAAIQVEREEANK